MRSIKLLREEQGSSRQELAEAIGVSLSALGYYERGERIPDADTIAQLSDFFNVTTDYLLEKTELRMPDADVQGAAKLTGLSEATISTLRDLNGSTEGQNIHKVLNLLIEHELLRPNGNERVNVLSAIGNYLFYSPDSELEALYSKWKEAANSRGAGVTAVDGMQALKRDLRATALNAVDKFISLESGDLIGDGN